MPAGGVGIREVTMMVLWTIGLGCSDQGFNKVEKPLVVPEPEVQVRPEQVDFGTHPVGCESAVVVHVANVGRGPLELSGTWLDGTDPTLDAYSSSFVEDSLPPGASVDVTLHFAPVAPGTATADLTVASDDPDELTTLVPIVGTGFDGTWKLDHFLQSPEPLDVLWVIDNSGSMWQERARVAANLHTFFDWFELLDLDYHMGVIATDIVNPIFSGRLFGSPTFVTPKTPDAAAVFARSIDFGILEMGNESGLAAMELALSDPLISGYNTGFYRNDARLVVMFISDEAEWSTPDAAHYVDFLDALKGTHDRVYVASIVGNRDHGCRGRCDATPQDAGPGNKYLDVSEAFGGFEGSICDCDLAPAMERIALDATLYLRGFPLSDVPTDPRTLQVRVDGSRVSNWVYDADRNAVVFDEAPKLGAEIWVRYQAAASCE
jgi:hypothetical protein